MQKLADINDGDMLQRGMFPDLPANQMELWRSGVNIEFGEKRVSKATGWTTTQAATGTIRALAQAYIEGLRRIYYALDDKVYRWEYGVATQIGSGFGGMGYWNLEPFGAFLLATNDYDKPKVWKNAGVMVDLAGVRQPRFRLIKKHMNHVLGYYGQSVDWSAKSNPELWEPDDDNDAGGQFIRDLDSDIIAAQPLGAAFGIYSFDKLVLQQYTGDPLYFGFRLAIDGVGAVSDSAIIPVGARHYGMGPKGVFMTDGVGHQYIDTPQIKKWILSHIDKQDARRTVGVHDEVKTTVKWWFPCNDDVIRGVSFNYSTQAWSILEQPVTAATGHEVYDSPIVASGDTWGFMTGADMGNSAMPTSLLTFPFHGGDRGRFKLWDMLQTDLEGSGLEVRFGFSDKPSAPPEWTAWQPLTYEHWPNRDSVYITLEFRSTALGVDWSITGMSLHGELTGNAT
jgi:hypothetical protein